MKYKSRVDGFNIEETEDIKGLSQYELIKKQNEWAKARSVLACEFIPIVQLSKGNFNK